MPRRRVAGPAWDWREAEAEYQEMQEARRRGEWLTESLEQARARVAAARDRVRGPTETSPRV